ncbi:hypothetical protein PsorP6_012303 [Peronosclerospora sorghi]|uniref:Uncharacterized protein n=1 Tax=Peronosclerospora sorghi TaxID=230839 RepID=A0ACC0WFX0_9STRA|nr:hypothetical protein PsorP6_012303 [Peronosclerospora sorghi]
MVPFLMFLSGVFMTFITETVSTSDYNQEQSRVINEVTSDWPSLQFQFKLKRSSMRPYRHSEFSMFANPVISADESSILYDIFASFNDGTVTSNYTLVNGVAYLQISPLQVDSNTPLSVQYLRSELSDILPINSIVSALNEATPVSNFSGISIDCNDGKIYKVSISKWSILIVTLILLPPNLAMTVGTSLRSSCHQFLFHRLEKNYSLEKKSSWEIESLVKQSSFHWMRK